MILDSEIIGATEAGDVVSEMPTASATNSGLLEAVAAMLGLRYAF